MKTLLYFEKEKILRKSGIGRALRHQKKALESANVNYTTDINEKYDLAHINTLFSGSFRLLKRSQKKGIPVIVHGHSTKEDFRNSFRFWKILAPSFNRMILRMYRRADAIITPTEYSKSLIKNYSGIKCPIYALSNGIDLDEYKYDEEKVKKYRDFFGLTTEKVVICAGLFFDRKGIRDFFEVARIMPDVKFIWFGDLKWYMVTHKINKAIKNRPNNVEMPGYIDGDIIKGAFLDADAMLFPSYEETEGIVVLEGLASRTPVIIRNIKVYDSWLVDRKHVLMGNNVEEFKQLIEYVFSHNTTELTNQGYQVVAERKIEIIGSKLKDIYEKVKK